LRLNNELVLGVIVLNTLIIYLFLVLLLFVFYCCCGTMIMGEIKVYLYNVNLNDWLMPMIKGLKVLTTLWSCECLCLFLSIKICLSVTDASDIRFRQKYWLAPDSATGLFTSPKSESH